MRILKKEEITNFKAGTQSILKAAFDKGATVHKVLDDDRVFILEKNGKKFWFRGPRLSISNPVSLWIIRDKYLTKKVLKEIGVPHPEGYCAKTIEEAQEIAKKIGFPLVMKPRCYEGGLGVFLNVDSPEKVASFFGKSSQYDKYVLLEKYVDGKYYRITMVNNKISGILETKGITLTGDGSQTVLELVSKYNASAEEAYEITDKTKDILLFQNLSLKSIPSINNEFILGFSGAEGGDWIDRTDDICKENSDLLIKMTKYLDLPMIGLDLIAKDISLPITATDSPGFVLEINGAPDFLFHLNPTEGKPRNIGKDIVDMLFN
ncbi:MAG: ATP-grasp domain-containing protein [bacterium]|nr:ATP-grasp domain-containing protein [bacterium]